MARIRTIKPDFFKNEQVSDLSPMVRLLFIGLWTQADREGKLEDRPKRIKAEIFPYDDFDINQAIDQLKNAGLLIRYDTEIENTKISVIKILTFKKHQQPNIKEAKSSIPEPVNIQAQYKHSTDTVQASQEGKGRERKGTGRERINVQARDEFFLTFPFDSFVFTRAWDDWKNYKKKEFRFNYKTAQSEQAAMDELKKVSGDNLNTALEIIKKSIANGWKGFFELNDKKQNKNFKNGTENQSTFRAVNDITTEFLRSGGSEN